MVAREADNRDDSMRFAGGPPPRLGQSGQVCVERGSPASLSRAGSAKSRDVLDERYARMKGTAITSFRGRCKSEAHGRILATRCG